MERRATLLAHVERATEIPLLVLAVVFLVVVALPEITRLPAPWLQAFNALDGMIWGIFALELLVRLYLAPQRRRYLVAHWPDVLIVALPFLRPLRLLRILVVVSRLWRQARSVLRYRTFSFLGVTALLATALAAAAMYLVERGGEGPIQSFADALWWAIATITTVGYGDVYPKTPTGRGIAVFLMLLGISLFGLLTARIAAFFVEEGEDDDQDKEQEGEHQARTLEAILARLERIEARLGEREQEAQDPDRGHATRAETGNRAPSARS
ncbi:MAG: potassium channel family protein [Chloroflexota bacterium]